MSRVKHFLYFACNIILILLGIILIFMKVEAIGGSLVAGGIAGLVMYWAIYVQKKITTAEEKILEKIRRFGIVDILARRLVKDELDSLFPYRAKKTWDVLGFSLATFYGDVKDGIIQNAAKKVKIRVLVVHPERPYCTQRDYEESLLVKTTKNEVLRVTKFIEGLHNPKIDIRWYKSIPTTSITMIDDEKMVAGPYMVGLEHRNTYSIRIKGGVLFEYYRNHFNKIWNDPKLSCKPQI